MSYARKRAYCISSIVLIKKEEKINENLDIIELEKARKNRDRER